MIAWKISKRLWDQTMEDAVKCEYCQEDGKHHENCPDKVPAGPERDLAMAAWGVGAVLGQMGESLIGTYFAKLEDSPHFLCGYSSGGKPFRRSIGLKMDEDAQRVFEELYPDDDPGDY